jgi:hypothetical protein
MFDTRISTDVEMLFDGSVILEMERLADEEDQAFLIGLLLIRLAEHRRAQGPSAGLRHLLVIEEAHRLLTRAQPGAGETSNPRTKAVESFANLLAEIRSYGQGVLIADQVPVKLASEVIKNSNLKIVHRLVADDDRTALASAMVMDERQRRALATLPAGQAAVFAEGQDAPVLVQVPSGTPLERPDDADLPATLSVDRTSCRGSCRYLPSCATARDAMSSNVIALFARMAQTAPFSETAIERLWPEIEMLARAAMVRLADVEAAIGCLVYRATEAWAQRRGAQEGWPFQWTETIGDALADAVLEGRVAGDRALARRFAGLMWEASVRPTDPFPRCALICPDGTCFHRQPVAAHLADDVRKDIHRIAFNVDADPDDRPRQTWVRVADHSVSTIEFPSLNVPPQTWLELQRAAVAACLCTAQQALVQQSDPAVDVRLAMLRSVVAVAPREDVVPPHLDQAVSP